MRNAVTVIGIGLIVFAIVIIATTTETSKKNLTCVYSELLFFSSGDIETYEGTFSFHDYKDSIVIEGTGKEPITFTKGYDGTYLYENTVYVVAYGVEEISFFDVVGGLRVGLTKKSCQ